MLRLHPLKGAASSSACVAELALPPLGADSADLSAADLLALRFRTPWVRAGKLPDLFCSWDLAYRCTRGGWLKPVLQGKRRTIYRLTDVLRCLRRIEAGEMPPRRSGRNTG